MALAHSTLTAQGQISVPASTLDQFKVDANVLVRLITRDDAKQVTAADAFVERGAWVSHPAVAEATWVLASVYDCGPDAIATAVEVYLLLRNPRAAAPN